MFNEFFKFLNDFSHFICRKNGLQGIPHYHKNNKTMKKLNKQHVLMSYQPSHNVTPSQFEMNSATMSCQISTLRIQPVDQLTFQHKVTVISIMTTILAFEHDMTLLNMNWATKSVSNSLLPTHSWPSSLLNPSFSVNLFLRHYSSRILISNIQLWLNLVKPFLWMKL